MVENKQDKINAADDDKDGGDDGDDNDDGNDMI